MVKYDLSLVYLYSENARTKLKDAAQLLKKSSQRLKYSLKTFEKEGVISNPYCIFDYSYFGLLLFRVYFKGAYVSEKDKIEILKRLNANGYVASMYEVSGEFDLVVDMECPNPSRFNKELRNLTNQIPSLNNHKIVLNIVTHIYPLTYLVQDEKIISQVPPEIIVGGDRQVRKFTEEELSVILVLFQRPGSRITSLAKATGMHVKTVRQIMQNLKKEHIIKGFKHQIDGAKLGISRFRVFLKLHNVSKERDTQMLSYLLQTKEVVKASRTVGDWDMEIDIESFDKIKIRKLIMQIREEFKDMIESFSSMEVYQQFKSSYLPKYYFHNEVQRFE